MNRLLIGLYTFPLLVELMLRDLPGGFTLIDPDGAVAEAIGDTIPPEYTEEEIFYFDPSDHDHPAGINVLEGIPPHDRPRYAWELCALLEHIFPQGAATLTRLRSNLVLLYTLRVLLDTKGATLLSVPKFLKDKDYRTECLRYCKDDNVLEFWRTDLETWDRKDLQAAVIDLDTKLGAALSIPVVRNILGQAESTFTFASGRTVIANLSRAKLGDMPAKLLGSLLAIRAPTPVFINDFGFYCTDQLTALLPRGGYTVAMHFLDELETRKQQNAVLSIDEKYAFRTNPDDAKKLAMYFGIMNPSVIAGQESGEWRTKGGLSEVSPAPFRRRLNAVPEALTSLLHPPAA